MFESYYTLVAPSNLPWYWFVPMAIMLLVFWIISWREEGLKQATVETLGAIYRVFIRDRFSLKAIDVFITGLILVVIARPLMHWPIAGMMSVFIGQWVITIAAVIMVIELARDAVEAWKMRKARKKATEV